MPFAQQGSSAERRRDRQKCVECEVARRLTVQSGGNVLEQTRLGTVC